MFELTLAPLQRCRIVPCSRVSDSIRFQLVPVHTGVNLREPRLFSRAASPSVSMTYMPSNQKVDPGTLNSASRTRTRCATGPSAWAWAWVRLRPPLQFAGGATGGSPWSKCEHTGFQRPCQGSISSGGPSQ